MKQYIKSYRLFFPNKIFGILFNFCFPVLVLLLIFLQSLFIGNSILLLLTEALLIIDGECLADFYVFGEIAKRDNCRNEYLKTSVKYARIMKKAFIADAVRRLATVTIIIFLSSAVLKVSSGTIIFLLSSVYFFTAASLCILRFIEDFFINILIKCAMYIVYTIFFSIIFKCNLIGMFIYV